MRNRLDKSSVAQSLDGEPSRGEFAAIPNAFYSTSHADSTIPVAFPKTST